MGCGLLAWLTAPAALAYDLQQNRPGNGSFCWCYGRGHQPVADHVIVLQPDTDIGHKEKPLQLAGSLACRLMAVALLTSASPDVGSCLCQRTLVHHQKNGLPARRPGPARIAGL